MLRTLLLSSFLTAAAFAHDVDYGSSTHTGKATAYHQGDYVDFTVEFKGSCYSAADQAFAAVVNNIDHFSEWLNQITSSSSDINYNVDLINTWRKDSTSYGEIDNCNNKYFASQTVNITFTKAFDQPGLSQEAVQSFYDAIQLMIAPYSSAHTDADGNVYAESSVKVTDVTKGLFEESIDSLRRVAQTKARDKATTDFISFLGEGYKGFWSLHSANFSENSYSYKTISSALREGSSADAAPAQLKLKPLSISAEGIFVFYFKKQENSYPIN